MRFFVYSAVVILLGNSIPWTYAAAEELAAVDIMQRSYGIERGEDAVSTLKFTTDSRSGRDNTIIMTMAWKNYHGKKGLDSKVIMFNEFPPDTKNVAFMGWLYKAELNKKDDMWLYLPELRSVRKMSHMHKKNHKEKHGGDEHFSNSVLQRDELALRSPDLDRHRLLSHEKLGDKNAYVIESQPKHDDSDWPYSKTVSWISDDNWLPLRVDYYDQSGFLLKKVNFEWQQSQNAWHWHRVRAENLSNGDKTLLEQSDLHVNVGIRDSMFRERSMKQGGNRFLRKVGL